MPFRMYDFECKECGVQEIDVIVCKEQKSIDCVCGSKMKKVFNTFNINMGVGAYGYYDETLQTHVSTNKQRKEICRKQEVTPMGDTPKPDGDAWV